MDFNINVNSYLLEVIKGISENSNIKHKLPFIEYQPCVDGVWNVLYILKANSYNYIYEIFVIIHIWHMEK